MTQIINKNRAYLLLVPVLILVVFLVYMPSLQYGKIWDDWILLVDFGAYKDPSLWPHVLGKALPFSDNYYRPLVVFTYVLESYLGLGDYASHFINILIHAINSCLLVVVALRVWPESAARVRQIAAIAVGVLYGLHPAMTEAVVWISGRFDLLATTFILLAICIDVYVRSISLKTSLIALCFLAGLLCKEMAITLPVILLLLNLTMPGEWGTKQIFRRERIYVYLALAIGLIIYLAIRYSALGYIFTPEKAMAFLDLGSPLQRLLLIGTAFWRYLEIMLLPFDLGPLHYASLPIAVTDVSAWTGLIAFVGLGCLLFVLIKRPATRFVMACLAASLVSLLPVLHLHPVPMLLANTVVADRAAMIPIIFVLLALGALLNRIHTLKGAASISLAAATWTVLSVLVVRSLLPLWQSDYVLWTWLATDIPECSYCRTNHAKMLLYTKEGAEPALKEANAAFALATQPWQAAVALGVEAMALRKLGRMEEAIHVSMKAVDTEPVPSSKINYEIQHSGLLIEAGRLIEAHAVLNRVIAAGGGSRMDVSSQLGDLALASDRPDIARSYYMKTYSLALVKVRDNMLAKTDDPDRWTRLGDMFTKQEAKAEAAAAYEEARRLRERNVPTRAFGPGSAHSSGVSP